MNVTSPARKVYDKKITLPTKKTKPKQTQYEPKTNPIKANCKAKKMLRLSKNFVPIALFRLDCGKVVGYMTLISRYVIQHMKSCLDRQYILDILPVVTGLG